MAVNDVGAGVLPQALQLLQLGVGAAPQLFISALQEVLRCNHDLVHPELAFMRRLMDFLHKNQENSGQEVKHTPAGGTPRTISLRSSL